MPFDQFRRRDFVRLLLGGAAVWPLAARAQVRRPVVGYLAAAASPAVVLSNPNRAFVDGLREHGYFEGREVDIVYKFADGFFDRLPALAQELVGLVLMSFWVRRPWWRWRPEEPPQPSLS